MKVLVLGAGGEMGGRLLRLFAHWAPHIEVQGASRSGRFHKSRGATPYGVAPLLKLDARDSAAVHSALAGVQLLVNAAGPYNWPPKTLVQACIRRGVHYADFAEGRDFIAAVHRAARAGRTALQPKLAVVPGCSTVPGLLQLVCAHWRFAAGAGAARVEALLCLGARNPPSAGLLAGLLRPLGRPLHPAAAARAFTSAARRKLHDGRAVLGGNYPAAFARGGVQLGGGEGGGKARRVPLLFYAGFAPAWITRALMLAARPLARLPPAAIPPLSRAALPLAHAARAFGTPRGALLLRALNARGAELARAEILAARHGLDIPAAPALWLARRLAAAKTGAPQKPARALHHLVAWPQARAWLRGAGYEVFESGGASA